MWASTMPLWTMLPPARGLPGARQAAEAPALDPVAVGWVAVGAAVSLVGLFALQVGVLVGARAPVV